MATGRRRGDNRVMIDVLGITIWREARGAGTAAMVAVYHVIKNRATDPEKRWPQDMDKVCLQAYQFSCWNTNDPQRNKYPEPGDLQYQQIQQVISAVENPDPTEGANFYYDTSIAPPDWTDQHSPVATIGSLRFYKL